MPVFKVYNTLGYGFLERVYENAMRVELERQGLTVASQVPIKVYYEGIMVGDYVADLCVEKTVIVELKAANGLEKAHEAQLMNYLRATGMEVGLLLNFGPKAEFLRRIYTPRSVSRSTRMNTDSALGTTTDSHGSDQ